MNIIEQMYYDIYLDDHDELGKEILDIVSIEKKQNKKCNVIVHQIVQIERNCYTIILNLIEKQ